MKYLATLFFSLALLALEAQESLSAFEHITVTGNVKLTLSQGSPAYEATGDTDDLKVKVEQGKLKITNKKVFRDWDKPVEVLVTYQTLRSLSASAGAQVESGETITAAEFELNIDMGANADLTIEAQALEARVGEGGVLRLTGSGRVLEATANTGGVLKARDYAAQTVYVKANTGALASVHASESIEANASLGGSISYSGNPTKVQSRETTGGSIRG